MRSVGPLFCSGSANNMAAPCSEEVSPGGLGRRGGRNSRTLLVRHLPAVLTASEKEDLLRHFGASSVRVLSDLGRLVGCGEGRGFRGRVGGGGLVFSIPPRGVLRVATPASAQ